MGSPARKANNEVDVRLIDERVRLHYDRLGQSVISDVVSRYPILQGKEYNELQQLVKKSPQYIEKSALTNSIMDAIKKDNEVEAKQIATLKSDEAKHIAALKSEIKKLESRVIASTSGVDKTEKEMKKDDRERKLLKEAVNKDAAKLLDSDVFQRSVTQEQKINAMLAKANTIVNGHVPKIATLKRYIASIGFFKFLTDLALIVMTIMSIIVSSYGQSLFNAGLINVLRIVIDMTIVSSLVLRQFMDKRYLAYSEKRDALVTHYQEALGIIAVYDDYRNLKTLAGDSRTMAL
ncbi:unnamed protein product [Bemisia tabaci]|uniref:Uncharacterized protein n=1 Tax=Bemisia tabaci TaxID=7038 RepID=A0A9P0AG31_BEMTA|nr:unnamed protein product [Bemisia tabaci]